MATQSMSPTSDNDSNARKRVCKACDRCRLKKSKCDGSSPCNRCRTDNAICVFGERKKSHDKVYPKGYVEMLEQQQQQLVTGLQELYELVIKNQGWKGAPLKESTNGHPLTHDILERLGALKLDSNVEHERFEDDLDILRQRLAMDAAETPKKLVDSNYQTQSSFIESVSPKDYFKDPCPALNQFPPTPPIQSPHQQAHTSIRYIGSQNHAHTESGLDPSILQSQRQTWMQQQSAIYDENLDYLRFDPPSSFDALDVMQDSSSPCLPISPWLDDDLSPFELSINMV